jgi:hypothetical protein
LNIHQTKIIKIQRDREPERQRDRETERQRDRETDKDDHPFFSSDLKTEALGSSIPLANLEREKNFSDHNSILQKNKKYKKHPPFDCDIF